MGGTICRCDRKSDQVAKAILNLPWFFVNNFLAATNQAEETLGRPATCFEILETLEEHYNTPIKDVYQVAAVLFSLLREDLLYCDSVCYKFSTFPHEGFLNYSQIFYKKFKNGYKVIKDGSMVPTTAKSVSLADLFDVLKSSDASLLADRKQKEGWFDGDFKFLNNANISGQRVAFNSFPRSGNSFLRRLLEQISGLSTGATVSMHTATSLQIMGMKGEGISDDRVWIVKAHHPLLLEQAAPYECNKVICCVRNPLDVFPSYASLCNSINHATKPEYEYEVDYPEWWDWFVRRQTDQMRDYFEILIRNCTQEKQAPIYFVRYEDLITHPKESMEGLFKFLLDIPSVEGRNIGTRIQEVVDMGASATQTYSLKSTTGKFNINASRYSAKLLEYVQQELKDVNTFFGYSNHPEQENATAFFDYANSLNEADLARFNKFRQVNEESIRLVCSKEHTPGCYKVNQGEYKDLISKEDKLQINVPGRDWARKQLRDAAKKTKDRF